MASEIRVDKINSLSGVGTVTLSPTGVDIAGITTAATLRATTGIVTSLTAGSLTSLGAVSGTTGTFSAAVSGTTAAFTGNLSITNTAPQISLVDSDNNSDFSIYGAGGVFNIYDETNSASRLTIASDGTVSVLQGLELSSTLTIPDSIIHSGDTDTKIRFADADTISFETGGSTRAKITSTGNFEMPNDNDYIKIGAGGDLQLVHSGSASFITNSTGFLEIQSATITFENASGTERGRFTSNGEFGVNTTAPVEKLGVSGNMRFVNANDNTSRITALPSGTYNVGNSGGSAIAFHRFSDSGGGSDEIFFETHHQGNFHGETLRIEKSGDIKVKRGDLYFETAGKGIVLGATSNTAANTLDDYEEGTFTPTCESGGFNNWSTNVARYTKIGRLVNVSWEESFSGTGDGSVLRIGGLPFVADDWTPGSMYAQTYSLEGSHLATAAVGSQSQWIKVITWGGEALGNQFSGYSAWNITYTTSS